MVAIKMEAVTAVSRWVWEIFHSLAPGTTIMDQQQLTRIRIYLVRSALRFSSSKVHSWAVIKLHHQMVGAQTSQLPLHLRFSEVAPLAVALKTVLLKDCHLWTIKTAAAVALVQYHQGHPPPQPSLAPILKVIIVSLMLRSLAVAPTRTITIEVVDQQQRITIHSPSKRKNFSSM